MGRRGPAPTPTAVKKLRGNPGKRRLNAREPKSRTIAPRCPNWLNPEAKKVWKRLVPELRAMGVLSVVDGDAMANYCQAYARWKEAEQFLDQHGTVYPLRDEEGRVRCMQQFPQVAISRNMVLVMKALQQEFGLTPSARTRIHAFPPTGAGTDGKETEAQIAARLTGLRAIR